MEETIYLIEATVYDPAIAGTKVLRYSTGVGYVYGGQYYEPRVLHPGRLKRMLFGDGTTRGASTIGFGEVVLVNSDGGLDDLLLYGFDGRNLMIKRATAIGAVLSAVVTLAACSMEQPTSAWDEVAIRVKDRQQELNVPLQTVKYGGTNALPDGIDGTEDIKGQPKPLLFGVVKNATPVCVNTSRLIYQLNDGALYEISAVYDKGVSLVAGAAYADQADMEANEPDPGQYRVWLAGGVFRLGATPAGQVTADAAESSFTVAKSAAYLIPRLAVRAPTLAEGDVVGADVAALYAANGAAVGLYAAAETTIAAALDQVAASIGAWYAFDGSGQLRMGRLDAPTGPPVSTLTEDDVLSVERLATNDEGRGLPAWRATVGYDRNWSAAPGGWAEGINLASWRGGSTVQGLVWTGAAYGAGLFVAVSFTQGTAYETSTDGRIWTERHFPIGVACETITYGNGLFVISDISTGNFLTSPDGINWTPRAAPVSGQWMSIAYGNGVFVAVAFDRKVVTSPDGATWTQRADIPSAALQPRRVAFGGGTFVLVGQMAPYAYTSADGVAWTARALPAQYSSTSYFLVAYGNGIWLAQSTSGTLAYSRDGISWEQAVAMSRFPPQDMLFAGGYFWVCGTNEEGLIARTVDGGGWLLQQLPSPTVSFPVLATGADIIAALPNYGGDEAAALDLREGTARAQWLAAEYRAAAATDAAVQVAHPLAREIRIDTLLVFAPVAQAEADRLLALYSVNRDRLRVRVPIAAVPADVLGKVLLLKVPRYGYSAGKLMVVIGTEEDYETDFIYLDLWG